MREPGCTPRSAVDEVRAMAYHILVVEDEPDTRELLDFALWWNGHHVDTPQGMGVKHSHCSPSTATT